jgi:hypothetical protein
MSKESKGYLEQASPGIWFVGSCRTWTDEQRVIAAIPLLMELYEETLRIVQSGRADNGLQLAVIKVSRILER